MECIKNFYEDEGVYIVTTDHRQFIEEKRDLSSVKRNAFKYAKEGNFDEFLKIYDSSLYYMYIHNMDIETIQIQSKNYVKYKNHIIPIEYKGLISDNLFYPVDFFKMITMIETVYNKQRKTNLINLWLTGSIKIYNHNKVNIFIGNFSMADKFELLNNIDYRNISSIVANISDILDNFVLKKYTIGDTYQRLTYNKPIEKKYCKYCGKEIKFFETMEDTCDICAFSYGLISYKEVI